MRGGGLQPGVRPPSGKKGRGDLEDFRQAADVIGPRRMGAGLPLADRHGRYSEFPRDRLLRKAREPAALRQPGRIEGGRHGGECRSILARSCGLGL